MICLIARYTKAYFLYFGHVTFVRGHNAFYGYRPFISRTKENNQVKLSLKGRSSSYLLFHEKSDDHDLQGLPGQGQRSRKMQDPLQVDFSGTKEDNKVKLSLRDTSSSYLLLYDNSDDLDLHGLSGQGQRSSKNAKVCGADFSAVFGRNSTKVGK